MISLHWIWDNRLTLIAYGGMIFAGYAMGWALVRASYERVVGKPMPRTRLVLFLDILADLAINIPGAVNRALRHQGADPLFLPAPIRLCEECDGEGQRDFYRWTSLPDGSLENPVVHRGPCTGCKGTGRSGPVPPPPEASRASPETPPAP